ncbi:MAG: membrane protein insertase YidC [Nitrospirota bacterium]
MEKRVILFLIISLAVIIGYDYLLKEFGLLPSPRTEQSRESDKNASSGVPSSPASDRVGVERSVPADASAADQRLALNRDQGSGPPSEEQTVVVETDLFRAVLTNRGGVLKSWELKRYTMGPGAGHRPVQLVHEDGAFQRPLNLVTPDETLSKALNESLYQVEQDVATLAPAHPVGHVTFRYRDARSGVAVEKQLTFRYQSYLVDVAVRTEGLAGPLDIGLGTNFGIVEWGEGFIGLIGPASLVDDKVQKNLPDAEEERKGAVRWVALQDKYFLSVLIPAQATAAVIKKEGDKLVSAGIRTAQPTAGSGIAAQLYAGPKEYDTLKALNVGLEDTIDFGWFIYGSWSFVKAVAKPLFYVLRFLYDYTHNYGVTIILLTVGIKLLFVPLQFKSYKSMKQMQVIQPKVAALQAKYKDDRDRLNKELIKLYRDHKVNPVGGCLPMLLQMPVFVALFNILYMTIDLRQAPFILWITDLSAQDPYYVLPLIMGVTMVIQQKITPTTMDPTQAKIMLLLPVFMTFLFITFPAGLVLYWLTNNVLTIAQQLITERYFLRRPVVAVGDAPSEKEAGEPESPARGKRKKGQAIPQADAEN